MQKKLPLVLILSMVLSACQVTVNSPDGSTTAGVPKPGNPPRAAIAGNSPATAQPLAASTNPAAGLVSGVYSLQTRGQRKDGRGKLQNESAKFSYTVEDIGGGRARVKFEGESTSANPGGLGGTQSGVAEASGLASYVNGNWVMIGKNEDGPCEARFVMDSAGLRHLAGRCREGGAIEAAGWPATNTALRFERTLRDADHAMLLHNGAKTATGTSNSAASKTAIKPAAGTANSPAAAGAAFSTLAGKTFPAMQLPYQALGFDAFNDKIDQYSFWEMPEGKVVMYPVHKGSARFMVVAVTAGDSHRISEVRPLAANLAQLRLIGPSEAGDAITECTLNGKKVSQAVGYLRPGKQGRYAGQPSTQGESMWLVQPGGTQVIALNKGEKMACSGSAFSG